MYMYIYNVYIFSLHLYIYNPYIFLYTDIDSHLFFALLDLP